MSNGLWMVYRKSISWHGYSYVSGGIANSVSYVSGAAKYIRFFRSEEKANEYSKLEEIKFRKRIALLLIKDFCWEYGNQKSDRAKLEALQQIIGKYAINYGEIGKLALTLSDQQLLDISNIIYPEPIFKVKWSSEIE